MDGRKLSITGLVVALVVVGALFYFDTPSGNDERERLIAELQGFPEIATHETLLMEIVERAHDEAVEHNIRHHSMPNRPNVKLLDWEGYRADVYRELVNGLVEAGHSETALRLERYRARQ